jgi:DNA-binding IclR family transcriptional regulator
LPVETEVRSGGRLIRIVEMLAIEHRPVTAGEIATSLSIPPTTVQRLLSTLVTLRWAERLSARLYRLGPRMLGAGGLGLGRSPLVQLAKPVMGHIADLSGLESHLAVVVGESVTYLARVAGRDTKAAEFKLGALQPMHCTSAGKLLFAFLPQAERHELIKTIPLRSYTAKTIVDRDELSEELERIHEYHYSTDPGEFNDFWRSVAVPVYGPAGEVIAAITCGGRPEKMTVEHQGWIRQEMSVLAEELSGQLA